MYIWIKESYTAAVCERSDPAFQWRNLFLPGVFFWFILLFFRHRIYVTGFIKAAAGGTLKWSGKEEKIAVDGRFVLEKVPFGKQKWEVLMPDGTAY